MMVRLFKALLKNIIIDIICLAAVIGFEKMMYNGSESDGEIEITISVLQGELSGPVVVRISTRDGSALSDEDYEALNMTLTFSPDMLRIIVTVDIVDDQVDEEQEYLLAGLELEPVDGEPAIQIQPDEATILIEDNDGIGYSNK